MRDAFNRMKQKHDLRALREHMRTDVRLIKLKDNSPLLRQAWQEMRHYKDRLVSPKYGKQIFERRNVEVEFVGQNYLFREGVLDEVTKLYEFVKSSDDSNS